MVAAGRPPGSASTGGWTPTIWRRCCRAVTQHRGHRWAARWSTARTKDGKVVRAVAGFDATFSAPKSVSVWWALTGDPGLLDAHDVAVAAAVEHLERYGSTTRIRVHGERHAPGHARVCRWRRSGRPRRGPMTRRCTPTR